MEINLEEKSCKIAKITKLYGNDGTVVMRLYDRFPEEVDFEEPLFILTDGLVTPLFFNSFQRRGKSKAIATFDDIDTAYRTNFIVGCEAIALIDDEELADDGELYYDQMEGFAFVDSVSGKRGEITEFIDNENNPLFDVLIEGVSVMVPVTDDLIEEIDPQERVITMTLPEGLLELYM